MAWASAAKDGGCRPLIRELYGDRVRILQNSRATLDMSGLRDDHAVAADPVLLERIEVLRGPGVLLYRGNAVGGVVNMIDNRISREPLFDAKGGTTGKADLGLGGGNLERGGALLLETGTGRFALHADVFGRRTVDVSVPVSVASSYRAAYGTVADDEVLIDMKSNRHALGGELRVWRLSPRR